jgi:glycerol-3-phosphate acyltransferase PlsY
VLSPPALVIAALAGVGTIAASRIVSLGSLAGTLAGAGAVAVQVGRGRAPRPYLLFAGGGAAFLIFSHRDNVQRLLAGSERRLGQPAEGEAAEAGGGDDWPAGRG